MSFIVISLSSFKVINIITLINFEKNLILKLKYLLVRSWLRDRRRPRRPES